VSDVTPPDFAALLDPSAIPHGPAPEHLERAIVRWNGYLASGTFALSVARDAPIGASDEAVDFWTSPWPYWDMRVRAPGVWGTLRDSGLVIFKVEPFFFFMIWGMVIGGGPNSSLSKILFVG
jgi:damage-control phosphatase, subfamily III